MEIGAFSVEEIMGASLMIAIAFVSLSHLKIFDLSITNILSVMLVSDNNPILIGKDGKNLSSIQTIIRQVVNNQTKQNIKINVDASNYKERKIKNLEREIKKIARDVLTSKVDVKLDPMNSYERRIIHSLISEYENLETISEGAEPNRYVVIKYIEK